MTDITKFKSIAVKIDPYRKARAIADENYMSVGSYVKYLIDKDYDEYQLKLQKLNFKGEENGKHTNEFYKWK
tara:strand:- start:67 stop:282 length:216 start_codon:yes stop_codon:yes gene_type:complete